MPHEPDGGGEAALHQRLTDFLVEIGRCMELEVVADYGVPGGRLDVVWSWVPPSPMPGLVAPVPVVGFEIESGWQTRKHLKGGLLNLRDAGVALGVIVLAGAQASDDSLRRFATALVNRPGARVLIWTEEDLNALAAEQPTLSGVERGAHQPDRGSLPSFGTTYQRGDFARSSLTPAGAAAAVLRPLPDVGDGGGRQLAPLRRPAHQEPASASETASWPLRRRLRRRGRLMAPPGRGQPE
ncbi:MAG: hypothetical protein M3N25_01915 [Actinomycetota bacterium]|nr:hypothetical protein [Actinomycetota bacterium]